MQLADVVRVRAGQEPVLHRVWPQAERAAWISLHAEMGGPVPCHNGARGELEKGPLLGMIQLAAGRGQKPAHYIERVLPRDAFVILRSLGEDRRPALPHKHSQHSGRACKEF